MTAISNTALPTNVDESRRISAMRKIQVLDSQYETFYQAVSKLASTICNVPVAMITFVDDQSIWIKSEVGAPGVTQSHVRMHFVAGL